MLQTGLAMSLLQSAASAAERPAAGVTATLDIAAVISAVLWPLVVLVVLLMYRRKIPLWIKELSGRVTKLEFAGISLELAKATPFVPQWSGVAGALDLRQHASAV